MFLITLEWRPYGDTVTPVLNPVTDCCGMQKPPEYGQDNTQTFLGEGSDEKEIAHISIYEKRERQTCTRTILREDWGCNDWGVVSLSI